MSHSHRHLNGWLECLEGKDEGGTLFDQTRVLKRDQLPFESVKGCLGAVGQMKFGKDVADVALDGAFGNRERFCDLLIG